MSRATIALAALLLWYVSSPPLARGSEAGTLRVATTPTFFNPAIGQSAQIQLSVSRPGLVTIEILDRDRFVVRTFSAREIDHQVAVQWDGRDDGGELVPDEAYAVRVRYLDGGSEVISDPGQGFHPQPVNIDSTSYSRVDGVLSYRLERPSRVHFQAGQARPVASGPAEGPVLRTIVDRAPRAGGAVIELWNGMDESGSVYIPELQHFAVAGVAVPLPENSLITIGHRGARFTDYARRHRAATFTRPRKFAATARGHHEGLNAFEDRSPRVTLLPAKKGDSSAWEISAGEALEFTVALDEDNAPFFLGQPNALEVFIDLERVLRIDCPASPCRVRLPAAKVPRGRHRLGVNWSSDLGPVGVAVRWVEKS